jgi:16S rRNA (guanine527-N7)-methyltransferase
MRLAVLAEQTAVWGLPLSPAQLAQFEQYLALLLAWNARLNLTALRDPAQIELRHFLDSLSCALVTGSLAGRRLIDVGTGAGFPGLPLKILYPDLRLTLVESVGKKTDFLQTVVAELALAEVTILAERAEVLGQQKEHREQYDWAVARGVAEMRVLVEYLLPLCVVGGQVLAQKGTAGPAELAAAETAVSRLGGGPGRWQVVDLPGHDQPHYLIVVPKVSPTPPLYPRRPGMAGKRPLS